MVDISDKEITLRKALASCVFKAQKQTIEMIKDKGLSKGDALETAKLAGINAVKKTPEIVIYCHPIKITSVSFEFDVGDDFIIIKCAVKGLDRTGVEMEALTGAMTAALNIYDMVKSIDRCAGITDLQLLEKSGGKSGDYKRVESWESG